MHPAFTLTIFQLGGAFLVPSRGRRPYIGGATSKLSLFSPWCCLVIEFLDNLHGGEQTSFDTFKLLSKPSLADTFYNLKCKFLKQCCYILDSVDDLPNAALQPLLSLRFCSGSRSRFPWSCTAYLCFEWKNLFGSGRVSFPGLIAASWTKDKVLAAVYIQLSFFVDYVSWN